MDTVGCIHCAARQAHKVCVGCCTGGPDAARMIARVAHDGQMDKGGQPYIRHPDRVANAVRAAGYDNAAVVVAWLHDVVEDTSTTLEDLRHAGFSSEIIFAVDALSRRKHEFVMDYYIRVLTSQLAHIVKWFDVGDNASSTRLDQLPEQTQQRLTAKYAKARAVLVGPPVQV